jgi:uncharacterized protein (DUF1800 family)
MPLAATSAGKGQDEDAIFASGFESPHALPGVDLSRHVFDRLAYGPRPGDLDDFQSLAGSDAARLSAWLEQQLDPDGIDDSLLESRLAQAGYETLDKPLTQLWAEHVRGALNGWPQRYRPAGESEAATLLRAVYSQRQLFERMVEFWHAHFNVNGWTFDIAPVFAHYDRDVIRPHALGNFRQMLEAVASANAMLQYLDNASSRGIAFNENYARELLELHTLGAEHYFGNAHPFDVPVDGDNRPLGYCDYDVYEAARAFTGWTIRNNHWEYRDDPAAQPADSGEFMYWGAWHDRAGKLFMRTILLPDQPAMKDGRDVLDILATHPGTARHVCAKLCRRLVDDQPPQALVDSAAAVFLEHHQAPDQIARVVRHVAQSAAFMESARNKVKRPFEAFVAMLRATEADMLPAPAPGAAWNPYGEMASRLQQTGNAPFRWPAPDGFPDTAAKWTSVSALVQTWRLLSRAPQWREPGGDDAPFLLPVLDITRTALPAAQRSAVNIVDFWVGRAIGYTPAAAARQQVIDFLRQNAAVDEALNLDEEAWQAGDLRRHYTQSRLRAAVSLVFMLPDFHRR